MKKYLLIFACVFLASTLISTFYVLYSRNNTPLTKLQTDSINISKQNNEPVPIIDFTQPETKTTETKAIEKSLEFIMPVDSNEIGMKFSNNQLIYSKTLDEWIIHNGIDIVSKQGTPVLASEAGKILEISNNTQEGIKIVIEHNDGYKTIYSNLSTTKMVQEGQEIKKGQIISAIGKTASFEYEEKDHLHFEIYKNSIPINPLNLIK